MCLQCRTDAIHIARIAPYLHLMQAQKDDPDCIWCAGEYGIVDVNDPYIVIHSLKWFDKIDETNYDAFWKSLHEFNDKISVSPDIGYEIYSSLLQVKYPYKLRKYWVKNYISGFSERFYTYLAYLVNQYENEHSKIS